MAADETCTWDCIVVGAGVVGFFTAYHLTKQGKKVLVLEQFALPHTRGSSHGQSRIIRRSYTDPVYVALMDEAYNLWDQIEKESGNALFKRTGMLTVQRGSGKKLNQIAEAMAAQGVPYEKLTHGDIIRRYPMLTFPSDTEGVFDGSAGILHNDRCLSVLRQLITKNGGEIYDGQRVDSIWPGSEVTVLTDIARYRAHKVVLAPGPWAGDMLKKIGVELPLKTMRGMSMYWRDNTAGSFDYGKFPITLEHLDTDEGYRFIASFPVIEYPGYVKIVTRGEPPDRYCHPDERDLDENGHMIKIVADAIRKNYPGLHDKPSIVEPAMYTVTPDNGYVIDHHPLYTNILMGVGMSGHGFKTAPVTGKLLAEMVLEKNPSHDLTPFRLSRFIKRSQAKLNLLPLSPAKLLKVGRRGSVTKLCQSFGHGQFKIWCACA